MHPLTTRLALGAGLLAIVAACGKDSTAPLKAASATVAGAGATGTVGAVMTPAPTFTVLDAAGNAMANVSVTVAVTGGGGSIAGAPTKTTAGATPVGVWTLGNSAGINILTVTVSGLATPVTITATGTPDVPSQITVNSGGTQSAFAGAALASPVVFKVGDRFNNGIAGQSVAFGIATGGGSLSGPSTVTTDAAGLASAPAWTLGKSRVAQQLRATSGVFTVNASATVSSDFNVDVRFFGAAIDPTIQAAFTTAASRIEGLITGDIQNFTVTGSPLDIASCGVTGGAPLPVGDQIDDIRIYAR